MGEVKNEFIFKSIYSTNIDKNEVTLILCQKKYFKLVINIALLYCIYCAILKIRNVNIENMQISMLLTHVSFVS